MWIIENALPSITPHHTLHYTPHLIVLQFIVLLLVYLKLPVNILNGKPYRSTKCFWVSHRLSEIYREHIYRYIE